MRQAAGGANVVVVHAPHHPTVELLVDGTRSQGAYAVLDIHLPRGLEIPRHVRRDHTAVAQLLDGVLELQEDDRPPVIVHPGLVTLPHGRPIAARVLQPARLVVIVAPGAPAALLQAAVDPDALPDDRAALLAAAGITPLPALAPRRGRPQLWGKDAGRPPMRGSRGESTLRP